MYLLADVMVQFRLYLLAAMMALLLRTPCLLGADRVKPVVWLSSHDQAMSYARKEDRIVLVYFSGSDWDPWCEKLDSEVLNTEMFRQWASSHVILLRVDFPRERHVSSIIMQQDERLKLKYSVSKTPTFIFLDPWGEPVARAGFDEVRLREDEHKGEPKACIAYLDGIIRNRPPEVKIINQPDFVSAIALAKKKYGILVMLISHGNFPVAAAQRDDLLRNQQFVKFINQNVTFVQVQWPEDSDFSQGAEVFRAFVRRQKLSTVPLQLIVWDAPYDQIKTRIFTFDPSHTEQMISRIQAQLPHIDYTGGWITDYAAAKTIAAQQDRYIFLNFTSMDGGEWSRRMDEEIFQTQQFQKYARKCLVLVRIDFPTATTQPENITAQNKMLADLFNIRGFPTVIVVNPIGQKLVESKYMKGGPGPFLAELEPIIQHDMERRAALRD